ncbi:ankyrin repeat domain-containing protein [Candidatus Babeliales bacterium]|nr:ankyrin repeat domain-containing protein [Candidatus Babeliales bacterium]
MKNIKKLFGLLPLLFASSSLFGASLLKKKRFDYKKTYPLHFAVVTNQTTTLTELVKDYAKINQQDSKKNTPLMLAAEHGSYDCAIILLANGADPNFQDPLKGSGNTPLHLAASNGNECIIQLLLEHGAIPTFMNCQGNTPLHLAVLNERPECASLLADHLLSNPKTMLFIGSKNLDGLSPIDCAQGEMKKILLATYNKALHCFNAARSAGPSVCPPTPTFDQSLQERLQQDSTFAQYANDYPLHFAAFYNQQEVLTHLLKKGSLNVNTQDEQGKTPLFLAAQQGHYACVVELLQHQANPSIFDRELGNTPLHFAAAFGHADIVNLLLMHGADATQVNHKHSTPLHLAALKQQTPCIKFLANHLLLKPETRIFLENKNLNNNTPLDQARGEAAQALREAMIKRRLLELVEEPSSDTDCSEDE